MLRSLLLAFFIIALGHSGTAQLSPGSTAPNFSVQDINGNNFTLYNQTSGGKGVIIDFFATWCGPCWSFHNSGTLSTVLSNLGAIASVVGLEADTRTNLSCMYGPSGCNFSTLGNWTGVPYQQANLTSSNGAGVAGSYAVAYYPTVYVVSHDNRAYEIRSKSYGVFRSWLEESFFLDANPVVQHSTCGDDGSVTLNRVKGYGSIRYDWSNGDKTENLTNIGAGTYTVTVTDQNGYDKVFGPIVVNGPTEALALSVIDRDDVSCFGGNDGQATALATGGNSGYQYRWSNGQVGPTAVGLSAGPYSVSVTDAAGCTDVQVHTVNQPAFLSIGVNQINEECGKQNGEIYVNASGGTFPYTYDIGEGPTANSTFTNLEAGVYDVKVVDRNNCEQHYTTVLRSLDGPDVSAGPDGSMDCDIAFLTLNGGGSAGSRIEYEWTTTNGTITGPTDQLITEVSAPGTYVLTVKDKNTECFSSDTAEVVDKRSYPVAQLEPVELMTCRVPNVWAAVEVEPDVNYSWSTVDGMILSRSDSSDVEVGISAWYHVTAQNEVSGCVTTDSVFVIADIQEPTYELEQMVQDQLCPEDQLSFELTELDSLTKYSFEWSTVEGEIVGADSLALVEVKEIGKYYVQIVDIDNGCVIKDSVEVTNAWNVAVADFVASKAALEVSFDNQSQGENATYYWDFGDGETSTNENPSHTYENEGTFEVCLTTTTSCGENETCKDVEVSEQRGPFKIVEARIKHVGCFGEPTGEIELLLEGGYPPYVVRWSNGGVTADQKDLEAGTYDVELEDAQGQTLNDSYKINEPELIELVDQVVIADKGNAEGAIELEMTGGVAPYEYLWSNGSIENPATGLEEGSYSCRVTDLNGCEWQSQDIMVALNTSSRNFDKDLKVSVYPNPGTDQVCIDWMEGNITRIDWIDITGAWSQSYNASTQVCERVGHLNAGVYILRIWNDEGKFTTTSWVKMTD